MPEVFLWSKASCRLRLLWYWQSGSRDFIGGMPFSQFSVWHVRIWQ